jgi:CHAT domain-containing protein/Tfp pilus assembly protein PilF
MVLVGTLVWTGAAPAEGPPLLVRGELTDTDPVDRVQKPSPARVHEIELKAGQAILAELRSIDFDPWLRVEDDEGKILGQNDDIGPGNLTSRLGFLAPRDGTYRLVVTSPLAGWVGQYQLEVVALQSTAEPEVIRGELTNQSRQRQGRRYALHPLQVQPDRWHLLDLTSRDFDPVLVLADGQGKVLTMDKDGGEGHDARLVWPAGTAESWQVQVGTVKAGAGGRYVLQVRAYRGVLKAGPTEREKIGQQASELRARGVALAQAGNYPQATVLIRQALDLRQQLYPAQRYAQGHPHLARSLNDLGVLLQAAGQYEPARGYLEQVLAMRQKLYPTAQHPQGHPDLADSLSDLGKLQQEAGRYESARGYYEQALAMRKKLYPQAQYPHGHPLLAAALNNMGTLLQAVGQFDMARGYHEQALAMHQQLYPAAQYPQGHIDLASSLSNLGLLLQAAGLYQKARGYLEQALAMMQQLYPAGRHPQGHPYLAISLHNLGTLLHQAGQYEPARAYYEQALTMTQQLYPPAQYPQGHPQLAASLNILGLLLQQAGQYAPARDYLNRALEMRQKLYPQAQYPRGHPDLAASLYNLGLVLQDVQQDELARGFYEQALEMRQKLYPATQYPRGHPDLAASLNNLGHLLQRAGQSEPARGYFERALAMKQKLYPQAQYPDGHPHLAGGLCNLGVLLHATGQSEPARDYLVQALRIHNRQVQRDIALAPETQALDRLCALPHVRDAYLAAALDARALPEALYAELWPARGQLSRLLQRRHQAARLARQHDPAIAQQAEQLGLVRAQLARLLAEPRRDADRPDKEVARLSALKDALEGALVKLLPELERGRQLDGLGPTDLSRLLPAGHAFIDVLRYIHHGKEGRTSARYLAFVLLPGQPVKLVPLADAAEIDRAVRAWRQKIASAQDGPSDARRVAALVWTPLARTLPADVQVIYLAPDGELARLPWAALPGKKEGTVLLEELTFAAVPHGPFLLEQLKYAAASPAGPERVVGLGNVAYGPSETPVYPALPGTAAELHKLQELADKREVTILESDQAGWPQLLRALPLARYAHLATHGYYDEKGLARERQRQEQEWRDWQVGREHARGGQGARTPLAFTGLVLAGANGRPGDVPSLVTAEALVELPLENLRLCVLSACESGLGDLGPLTGEAVQGLPHALHLAGCTNVISSLWNVNDQATAALMAKLYDGLWREGKTPLEALRQAQLLVYRHPERIGELAERGPTALKTLRLPTGGERGRTAATKLWAGFVLSGPGR